MLKTLFKPTENEIKNAANLEILQNLKISIHNHAVKTAEFRANDQRLKGKKRTEAIMEFYLGSISTLDFIFSCLNENGSMILPYSYVQIIRGDTLEALEKPTNEIQLNSYLQHIFTIVKPSKI